MLGSHSGVAGAAPLAPVFAAALLDTPLVTTGMFGERRARHFHAGLDLSVGGVVGMPVRAPMAGRIERVRAQGVGYGRSLYLRTTDGRLVVLGHLDAFAEPIASFIAEAQDSSGQYEQDLWPPKDRFAVAAGQLVAWAGRSGTSAPHLHVEVRRGDLALNPVLAGIPVRDLHAPEVRAVTLEPLDASSWVERGAGPLTRSLAGAAVETVLVEGRVRAIVRAVDPGERGAMLAPWRLRETWNGRWIEWRADTASWASDMADVDFVYDVGRAIPAGAPSYQMWSPAARRPAMLRSNAPDSLDGGLIEVAPGDPARPLRFEVEDLAGRVRERVLWLRGPRSGESGASPLGTGRAESAPGRRARGAAGGERGAFEFIPLPRGFLRLSYRGAPADLREAKLLGAPATRRGAAWHAVISPDSLRDVMQPVIAGRRAAGIAWADSARPLAVADARRGGSRSALLPLEWALEAPALFEPAMLFFDIVGRQARGTAELAPVSDQFRIEPTELPLRSGIQLRLDPRRGELDARTGLYLSNGSGWDWIGGRDTNRPSAVSGDSRRLGSFAALVDTLAPRVTPLRTSRRRLPGAYPRWALRARVAEYGSGLDVRGSFFAVDGRRVPSEFDAVRQTLQWIPISRPAKGAHRYTLEVRDRAGNLRRHSGTFVLD
ncbi:MAG: M23 family metallopeptidase [Candidatus Eisenbacteria bacterium]